MPNNQPASPASNQSGNAGKPTAATYESRHERRERMIDTARQLLLRNYTTGEIKRKFLETFGVKYRQTHRYIRHARDRNLEYLNKTADQHLSDSVADWTAMRNDAEETIFRCTRQLQDAGRVMDTQQKVLADPHATDESRATALEALTECRKLIDSLNKRVSSCRMTIQLCRDRTDKLLGNYAPVKMAQTTTDGRDVAKAADSRPEPADVDTELAQLRERFENRITAGLNAEN